MMLNQSYNIGDRIQHPLFEGTLELVGYKEYKMGGQRILYAEFHHDLTKEITRMQVPRSFIRGRRRIWDKSRHMIGSCLGKIIDPHGNDVKSLEMIRY